MTPGAVQKVYITLGVIIVLSWTSLADNEIQNRSKYKYGYVISHQGGSTQAHLESRDGNLALGRYYVNLPNGTGQKVTYFADDLGFHSGVSYSSQNGKGSSKTSIALGQKALAAFGDSHVTQNTAVFTPTLLFGKKILKTVFNTATAKPGGYPQLNYTPVPGGFFLTQHSVETANGTADQSGHISDLPPSGFPAQEDAYSAGLPQKANIQTSYPTSESVKNLIKEFHIESTTPPIKSYTPLPQQSSVFSPIPDEASGLSQGQNTVGEPSYSTSLDNLSYSKQKSIEKTAFADIDAQILSEVQKHAEGIIMKDLQRNKQANEITGLSSTIFLPSTVTMQPIVVTNDGETGLKSVLPTTAVPETRKLSNGQFSNLVNSVQTKGKNPDQTLEDSGYFRVSLSPSLPSSINVSQTPHQSINVESTDRNSDSNNSTLCGFNLCERDSNQIFPADLSEAQPNKETQGSGPVPSDVSQGLGTNKIIRTFYPENKVHDERHYITTIDVQKAISLDVNQNEAGSIRFAQNFPFDKIKPFPHAMPTQSPTPQPLVTAQVSVTPPSFVPEVSPDFLSTPQKPSDTTASGLNDLPNQSLVVFNGLNDITSSHYGKSFQERAGNNRYDYENQLVVPPPPVDLTNPASGVSEQNPQDDFKEVEKSIQELRQQILSDIDAQHEEEQKKQNLVDQERKQYFQNLEKVEALKNQNFLSYSLPVVPQSSAMQSTASPLTSSGVVTDVQLVPRAQYVSPSQVVYDSQQPSYQHPDQNQLPQPQQTSYQSSTQAQYHRPQPTAFEPPLQTYQTEIKDFRHEVAVPQPSTQQISNFEAYQKPAPPPLDSAEVQTPGEARQYSLYNPQHVYPETNNPQLQSAPTYPTENAQLSNYEGAPAAPAASPYAVTRLPALQQKPNQLNAVPLNLAAGVLPQTAKVPAAKTLLFNNVLPLDYSTYLRVEQPLSLLQTYPVALPTESKLVSGIYPLPVHISQSYGLGYPEFSTVAGKHYHSVLTQRPTNKLRVQPLKPSTPDDSSQREAVQNLLSQPQFHRTYLYPGFPINNRLQLRHIRKNQISNSDQVPSQSVRRAKSLKNLRIEYGFKPPLRPSVEFSEEVKPSIYGPSVQPQ